MKQHRRHRAAIILLLIIALLVLIANIFTPPHGLYRDPYTPPPTYYWHED